MGEIGVGDICTLRSFWTLGRKFCNIVCVKSIFPLVDGLTERMKLAT